MEPVIWMLIGAGGIVALIITRFAAKHGWAWVQAQLKARAEQTEAAFKAKVSAAVGDLEPRITAIENQIKIKFQGDIDKLKEDVAALEAKVPH